MRVAWYDRASGGRFDWPVDIGDGQFAARRKRAFVIQLSDPGVS